MLILNNSTLFSLFPKVLTVHCILFHVKTVNSKHEGINNMLFVQHCQKKNQNPNCSEFIRETKGIWGEGHFRDLLIRDSQYSHSCFNLPTVPVQTSPIYHCTLLLTLDGVSEFFLTLGNCYWCRQGSSVTCHRNYTQLAWANEDFYTNIQEWPKKV
jgi:hypothetical protein